MAQKAKQQPKYIVGIDEVGRGPLAGPVSVGIFAIPYTTWNAHNRRFKKQGLTDSKKLSAEVRAQWVRIFKDMRTEQTVAFTVVSASPQRIDTEGIAVVIRKSIAIGLRRLGIGEHDVIKLDGSLKAPDIFVNQETIIKGDAKHSAIAAASVVAKVHRDAYMVRQAAKHPHYGFDEHKGYGTKKHRQTISMHGLSPLHRASFCRNYRQD